MSELYKQVHFCFGCQTEVETEMVNLWKCNVCNRKFIVPKGQLPNVCPYGGEGCVEKDSIYQYKTSHTWLKELRTEVW